MIKGKSIKQESVLMASIANDKAMIQELMEGEKDLHTLTAKMVYPQIPRDMCAKDVKKYYHNERQESKGVEFAINYGGNANTISTNKGIPLREAKQIYDNYMRGFSGLKKYQDWRRQDWRTKGYIDLNPIFGYKTFIHDYNYVINGNPDDKFIRKRIGEINRNSINYPIQHSGALCSMTALIIFFNTLRKKNWLFKVLLTVLPYDELNCEAPNDIADEVAQLLYDCMIKAGKYFCTRCTLDADIAKDKDGNLPTYWIH